MVVSALGLALVLGANLPFAVLAAVLVFVVVDRRDPQETFARIDLALLVFFASLFVVVEGLRATGYVDAAWAWIDPIRAAWEAAGDAPKAYTAGTWGPSAAVAMIERDGRTWHDDAA